MRMRRGLLATVLAGTIVIGLTGCATYTGGTAAPASSAGSTAPTAQVPTSKSLLPPGYYMLFILNGNGVPGVAPWVRVL